MRLLNPTGDNHTPGITWGQWCGRDECPYFRRWVFNFGIGSVRVHHWLSGDDPRYLHDHAWWFLTVVLRGGYTDVSEPKPGWLKWDHLHAGSVRFRSAHHVHSVQLDPGGEAWTLMLTGRPLRDWGFWVDGEWKRMRRYFKEHGHHPCD